MSAEDVEVVSAASGMVVSLMMLVSGLSLYCHRTLAFTESRVLRICLLERRGAGGAVFAVGTRGVDSNVSIVRSGRGQVSRIIHDNCTIVK